LRDEFSFRCVYCLLREQWGRVRGLFDLDHFHATANRPGLAVDYDNRLDLRPSGVENSLVRARVISVD